MNRTSDTNHPPAILPIVPKPLRPKLTIDFSTTNPTAPHLHDFDLDLRINPPVPGHAFAATRINTSSHTYPTKRIPIPPLIKSRLQEIITSMTTPRGPLYATERAIQHAVKTHLSINNASKHWTDYLTAHYDRDRYAATGGQLHMPWCDTIATKNNKMLGHCSGCVATFQATIDAVEEDLLYGAELGNSDRYAFQRLYGHRVKL